MAAVNVDGKGFFEARVKKMYSRERLANEAMVSYAIIRKIELGHRVPPETSKKVLDALGISVEEAFSRKLVSY